MKGAPERIVERCTQVLSFSEEEGKSVEAPINEEWKEGLESAYENLGSRGERVLGFCFLRLDEFDFPLDFQFDADMDPPNFPLQGLTFCGLISMIDPPRPTVPDAVRVCKEAGIRVVMITGKKFAFWKLFSLNSFWFSLGQETTRSLPRPSQSKLESSPKTLQRTLQTKSEFQLIKLIQPKRVQ